MRRIAHIDMDAFYASVELLRTPQLKGLPVVIGGGRRTEDERLSAAYSALPPDQIPPEAFPTLKSYVGRGVITTATYAARQFGIGSAMGLMKAAKLCPQAILLPVDFESYRHYSRLFKAAVRSVAPVVEDRGIDEVYADLTQVEGSQDADHGRALAGVIQRAVWEATGLTCSIGVAPNKLIAKMASEFNKPNGVAVLTEADLAPRIWPLPARKINGIGPKAEARLAALGVVSIGDLAKQPPEWLVGHFGKSTGLWLHRVGHGIDDNPIVEASEAVSISRETTFERDLHAVRDKAQLSEILQGLCSRLADDLARKGVEGRTIGVKLRFSDFKTATRDHSLDAPTGDPLAIRRTAQACLRRVDLSRPLRLLGVRIANLSARSKLEKIHLPQTASLFDSPDHADSLHS